MWGSVLEIAFCRPLLNYPLRTRATYASHLHANSLPFGVK